MEGEQSEGSRHSASENNSSSLPFRSTNLRSLGKAQRILVQDDEAIASTGSSGVENLLQTSVHASPDVLAARLKTPAASRSMKAPTFSLLDTIDTESSIMSHGALAAIPDSVDLSNTPSPHQGKRHQTKPLLAKMPLESVAKQEYTVSREETSLRIWLNSLLDNDATGSSGGAAAQRLVSRMRDRLWSIYTQDSQLKDAMLQIEQRLKTGHLKVSNAEVVLAPGNREQTTLRRALASYHPLWLRLSCEIAVGRPCGTLAVNEFVKQHVLADAALLAKHKGMRTEAYYAQLGPVVVKRLTLIIALLDRIIAIAPSNSPLLFRRSCGISSSSALLQAVLGPLLGETEVARHLGRLRYRVSYMQTPKEELDFKVNNLAVDFRDGLRLCRLVEVLGNEEQKLFEAARYPATRRVDRIYNVDMALAALEAGNSALTAAVVNGDKNATLNLLWRAVLQHEIPELAPAADINREIDHLELRNAQLESLRIGEGLVSEALGKSTSDAIALLQWMNAVAGKYGVQVGNFSNDLADGRAFCMLVHHYLGAAQLPLDAICRGSKDSSSPSAYDAQKNFAALEAACEKLGVPMMVAPHDFGGSFEHVVVLFSACLCHRLIEANQKHRAAMVLQRWWRKRMSAAKPLSPREHLYRWINAARVIQRCARIWLLRKGLKQFKKDRQQLEYVVTKLQASWRARPYKQQFLEARKASVVIQSAWRGVLARRMVHNSVLVPKIAAAALRCRSHLMELNRGNRKERAAVSIQSAWRGIQQRRQYQQLRREVAAMKIQSAWKSYVAQKALSSAISAVICIQSHARGMLARKEASKRLAAIQTIQSHARGFLAARHAHAVNQTKRQMAELATVMAQFAAKTAAAKRIQASWRGHLGRLQYQALLAEKAELELRQAERRAAAAALIASWGPALRDRMWFMKARKAAEVIQSSWRGHHAKRAAAAMVIQKNVKALLAVRQFERTKAACLVIQTIWRGYHVRSSHEDAEQLHSIRGRLCAATNAARSGQQNTLGARTSRALQSLQASRGRLPTAAVLQVLSSSTAASLTCCEMVVDTGAMDSLIFGAISAGRDKTMDEQLQLALTCVSNVFACRTLMSRVFTHLVEDGSLSQMTELLQQLRERYEPFMAAVAVFDQITKDGQRAAVVGDRPELVSRLQGVARLLGHKRASASSYLSKLEGNKGSDAAARQATRSLVVVTKQLNALGDVLAAIGASGLEELLPAGPAQGLPVKGKNTIVRSILAEISNTNAALR